MKRINFILTLSLSILFSCSDKESGIKVIFPQTGEPVQITKNGKEHLFASYYGINSWSKDQNYATVLETDVKCRLPDENDPATLGLVEMESHKFIPLTQTKAWNFQQGCMCHWLGTSPDSLVIYNDLRDGKFVSIIMNVHTQKEQKIIRRTKGSL